MKKTHKIRLAKTIEKAIDLYTQKALDGDPRTHLGASEIGHHCNRYLWYKFRWVFHTFKNGRQQRLLNRGHREEEVLTQWLEGIGCTVYRFEPMELFYNERDDIYFYKALGYEPKEFELSLIGLYNYDDYLEQAANTGVIYEQQQYRISDCKGHFGGSLDAILYLPEKIETETGLIDLSEFSISADTPILGEYKTQGTGAKFNALRSEGCQVQKEMHYDQQCVYGFKMDLTFSLYLTVNKNDDDIYAELIELDHNRGERLIEKANRIIFSPTPPDKISENPAYDKCKFCDAKEICHSGAKPLFNCRSCKFAEPIEDKQWYCHKWNGAIPKKAIPNGCGGWESIA